MIRPSAVLADSRGGSRDLIDLCGDCAWVETALAERGGLKRPVQLLESALVQVPLVVGHVRPVILLPLGAVAGLSPNCLEAILAHELAHVLRRDYLVNLLQTVAEALFFYHPAVWFMGNCLRAERENCCDDTATALVGGDPLRLARALTALAEWSQSAVIPTAPRLALAGDAAHLIHPIAGQGINLGLRDIAALAEAIVDAARLGLDPGSPDVLERYQRWRRFDTVLMGMTTDGLNRLFSNGSDPLRAVRDLGLGLVNRMPRLKDFFIRQAAGLSGEVPRLLKGEAI